MKSNDILELIAVFCEDYTIEPAIFEYYVPHINKLIENDRFPEVGDQILVPRMNRQRIINVCYNTSFRIQNGPELLVYEFQIDRENHTDMKYSDIFDEEDMPEDLPKKWIVGSSDEGFRSDEGYMFLLKSYYNLKGNIQMIESIQRGYGEYNGFPFGDEVYSDAYFKNYIQAIDQFRKEDK